MLASLLITLREGLEAALIVGIVLGVLRKLGQTERSKPVWAGVVIGIMFVSLAAKSRTTRYYIFALYSVVAGFFLSILRFEVVETGTLLYFLAMGVFLIPSGLILFIRFLRKYPKPAEELNNG